MDQYISTYQKDYTWPSTRIKYSPALLREGGGSCRCDTRTREIKPIERCGDEQDWSRVGPMGRLLDPKLYPAKTGPHPETEVTKHDQPSTYMKKLEEKYPNLYGILQSTPTDEIVQRVDQDRLRTTYQTDFSEKAEQTMAEISAGPSASVQRQAKSDGQPSTRSRLKRDSDSKDQETKGKKSKRKAEEDNQETRLPPWRSEYQDSISRLGHSIMKTKIHRKKDQSPAWAMAVT